MGYDALALTRSPNSTPGALQQAPWVVPRWATVLACLLLGAFPWLWMQYLAGDTLIHFVFAENAAAGRFFEYNPGELCAGETSPGYMLLLAGVQLAFGPSAPVLFCKALGFACWYGLLFVVYRVASVVFDRRSDIWVWAVVLGVGLMPGSVANAVMGMENVVFALWVWLWLWWAVHSQWLSRAASTKTEWVAGALLGLAAWIRPEALPFALAVAAVRAWSVRGLRPTLLFLSAVGLAAVGLWAFAHFTLGHSPYGAGVARVQLSADVWLGSLPVSFKFLTRLLAYGCLSLPAIPSLLRTAARLLRRAPLPTDVPSSEGLLEHLAVQLLVAGVLFSTIFPSVHLARYTLFVWPMLAIHAARGVQLLATRVSPRSALAAGLSLASGLVLVFGFETKARLAMARGHTLGEVLAGPARRGAYTETLLTQMGAKTDSVVVGVVEVQLRYFVDRRITVRSLDGLLDERMAQFTRDGQLDGLGYLAERKVDYLLDHPDFLSTKKFSYAALHALPIGGQHTQGGLTFTRVAQDITRIAPTRSVSGT